jgi:L-alanine-DL-glutamate epimerase-like enolase superfamily enzyme
LRSLTHSEITIEHGLALAPTTPGLGIDWDREAIDNAIVQ